MGEKERERERGKERGGCARVREWCTEVQRERVHYRMCSLTTECVLLLQNVFSYYERVREWCTEVQRERWHMVQHRVVYVCVRVCVRLLSMCVCERERKCVCACERERVG